MKRKLSKLEKEKQELIQKLNDSKKNIYKLHHYDRLTNLPNRKKLIEIFNDSLKKDNESGKAVFLLDIDRFHSINELYGRKIGDKILVQLAKRMQALLGTKNTVFYNGEDELCIIIENVSYFELRNLGNEIRNAVALPFQIEDRTFYITTSIGMSHYPMTAQEIELLLLQAEIAMYKVKRNGKDGFQVFLLEDAEIVERKRRIEFGLNEALAKKEMYLVYQPKVALNTGEIYSVEALLRWRHPTLGLVSPNEFIPIAEKSRIIIDIGDWVIEEAIRQTKKWHEVGLEISTSVNVSAIQFKEKYLVERIMERLKKHQLNPKYLVVEITESVMRNYKHTERIVKKLHENNIKVAIDDFGTGYSSLSALNNLYIDMIKIDQSFIQNIPKHTKSASLVKTMIQMGDILGFDIIAEGIETFDQSDFLVKNHCEYGQGYFFSKPIKSNELLKYAQKG